MDAQSECPSTIDSLPGSYSASQNINICDEHTSVKVMMHTVFPLDDLYQRGGGLYPIHFQTNVCSCLLIFAFMVGIVNSLCLRALVSAIRDTKLNFELEVNSICLTPPRFCSFRGCLHQTIFCEILLTAHAAILLGFQVHFKNSVNHAVIYNAKDDDQPCCQVTIEYESFALEFDILVELVNIIIHL